MNITIICPHCNKLLELEQSLIEDNKCYRHGFKNNTILSEKAKFDKIENINGCGKKFLFILINEDYIIRKKI